MRRWTTAELHRPAGRVVAVLSRHAARLIRHRKRTIHTSPPPDDVWLERVEEALNGIARSIQHTSMRKARRLHPNVSLPFERPQTGRIAVKVINHLGDEVMKELGA